MYEGIEELLGISINPLKWTPYNTCTFRRGKESEPSDHREFYTKELADAVAVTEAPLLSIFDFKPFEHSPFAVKSLSDKGSHHGLHQ
jgi:hypothetical protein